MKRLALGLAAVVVVALVALLGVASTKPSHIHFDRSITIDASPTDMAPYAEDLVKVVAWSPWTERDPDLEQSFSETTTGVGAWYAWTSEADDVGSGKQTITAAAPGKVTHGLEFFAPFEDQASSSIAWTGTDDGVLVTWSFDKDSSDLGTKVAQVFMDFEAMIGPDYEKGLANLKPMVEAAAAERLEAKAAAAKAAEEAAMADEAMAEDGEETAED